MGLEPLPAFLLPEGSSLLPAVSYPASAVGVVATVDGLRRSSNSSSWNSSFDGLLLTAENADDALVDWAVDNGPHAGRPGPSSTALSPARRRARDDDDGDHDDVPNDGSGPPPPRPTERKLTGARMRHLKRQLLGAVRI